MTYKVHASQRTPHERQVAREARRQSAGIRNNTGGFTFFTQGHGDAAPTPGEQRDAVRFSHGVETQGHQTLSFGPDFSDIGSG